MDEIYKLLDELREDIESMYASDEKELFDIYKFNAKCDIKELNAIVTKIKIKDLKKDVLKHQ